EGLADPRAEPRDVAVALVGAPDAVGIAYPCDDAPHDAECDRRNDAPADDPQHDRPPHDLSERACPRLAEYHRDVDHEGDRRDDEPHPGIAFFVHHVPLLRCLKYLTS